MSTFEDVGFFQELYSHIDKNSGGKFEDMFLIKIANKETSLRLHSGRLVQLDKKGQNQNLSQWLCY